MKIVFWRDEHASGMGGYYIRGHALNEIVGKWDKEGNTVVGIVVDTDSTSANIELILLPKEEKKDE